MKTLRPTFKPKSRERDIGKHDDWKDKPLENWSDRPEGGKKLTRRLNAVISTRRREDREVGLREGKAFNQFLLEVEDALRSISGAYERKYPGMKLNLHTTSSDDIRLDKIEVPKSERGKGIGNRVLKGLTVLADKNKKHIGLTPVAEKGHKAKLDRFYRNHGFRKNTGHSHIRDSMIRRPEVKESWQSPFSKLKSGKTPMQKAREAKVPADKLEKVRTSAKRFAEPINDPRHPDYEFSKTNSSYKIKSKNHPIEVSYTKNKDGEYIQNSTKTGETNNRISTATAMQRMKAAIANSARPGTVIHSQPVGEKRKRLNMKLGMGDTNERGVQSGKVVHRSPRQLAKRMGPMNPHSQQGHFIDPNHS